MAGTSERPLPRIRVIWSSGSSSGSSLESNDEAGVLRKLRQVSFNSQRSTPIPFETSSPPEDPFESSSPSQSEAYIEEIDSNEQSEDSDTRPTPKKQTSLMQRLYGEKVLPPELVTGPQATPSHSKSVMMTDEIRNFSLVADEVWTTSRSRANSLKSPKLKAVPTVSVIPSSPRPDRPSSDSEADDEAESRSPKPSVRKR